MIKIGICDDDKNAREQLGERVEKYFADKGVEYQIEEYDSGKAFIEQFEQMDILLLDIEMEEMDGIQLKDELRRDENIRILFVTSHVEGMPEAFGKNVYGFLEKPVEEEKFLKYMKRMVEDILEKEKTVIRCINVEIVVDTQDILYFKAEKKYSCLKMKESENFCDTGLKELEEELKQKSFFRCHKSYLVNLRNIAKIEDSIQMITGEKIPVARGKKQELKAVYRDYILRKAR